MPRQIRLGGQELFADRPVVWTDRPGVEPVSEDFHCPPEAAAALLRLRGPLILSIQHDDGRYEQWSNLWALHEVAAEDPFAATVRVYDRRWFWPYRHIARTYNKRRPVGFFRIEANDQPALQQVSEKFAYARFSIDLLTGKPWTPHGVLDDLLADLASWERANGGTPFNSRIDSEGVGTSIEDLELDCDGASAISQALAQMPGTLIRVDSAGTVVIQSQLAGKGADAQSVLDDLGEEIVGAGHAIIVDHRNEAPREIHVLFQPEVEVRFDYNEETPQVVDAETGAVADVHEEERRLHPVLPVPDYYITIDGQLVTQQTYADYFRYLAALPDFPSGGRLTDATLRLSMVPYSGIYGALQKIAPFDPGTDDDAAAIAANLAAGRGVVIGDWMTRMNALQAHCLRTFRLPRGWHDRVLAWRGHRVATANQATGDRTPAMAFGDYCLIPGEKDWLRNWTNVGSNGLSYAVNQDRWRETLDSGARPSPCTLMLDEGQGVIHLDYHVDPNARYDIVLPAAMDNPPSVNSPNAGEAPYGFNWVRNATDAPPGLTSEHRVGVILTAIPAGPNSTERLYRFKVKPGDIAGSSGEEADAIRAVAQNARGPILEVRVQASLETARIQWLDARRDDIERLFGVQPGTPNLDGLVVNRTSGPFPQRGEGGATTGAALDEISKQIAMRVWASYISHPQGSQSGLMSYQIAPRGWTDAVVHTVLPSGDAITTAHFPERVKQIDWLPRLRPDARAVILRLAYQSR